jgi:acyl-CoA thioesterase
VKAVQKGKIVFILLCSFQKPEPWQPTYQWKMPAGVPPPDECELEEVRVTHIANESGVTEKLKNVLLLFASVCMSSVKLKLPADLMFRSVREAP